MEPNQPQAQPNPPRNHRCPTCGGAAPAEGDSFPFCSIRCRMADLGRWFDGKYVVTREITEDDLDDPALRD